MNIKSQSSLHAKKDRYHFQYRKNQIEKYKDNVRKQLLFKNQFEKMISIIPEDTLNTLLWSKDFNQLLSCFQFSKKFQLTPAKAVQLFRVVRKFPNLHTLRTFKQSLKIITSTGVNQIHQENPTGLFNEIMTKPKKFLMKSFTSQERYNESQLIQSQIIKEVFQIISLFWLKSDTSRNYFIAYSLFIQKGSYILKHYGDQFLLNSFLKIISASTFYNWQKQPSSQYLKILSILKTYLHRFQNFDQVRQMMQHSPQFCKNIIQVVTSYERLYSMKQQWVIKKIDENQTFSALTSLISFLLKMLFKFFVKNYEQFATKSDQIQQQSSKIQNRDNIRQDTYILTKKTENQSQNSQINYIFSSSKPNKKQQEIKFNNLTNNFKCHFQNFIMIGQALSSVQLLFIRLHQRTIKKIQNLKQIILQQLQLLKIKTFNQKISYNYFSCQSLAHHNKIDFLKQSRSHAYFILSNLLCQIEEEDDFNFNINVNINVNTKIQYTSNLLIYESQPSLIDTLAQNVMIETSQNSIRQIIYLICTIIKNVFSRSKQANYLKVVQYKKMMNKRETITIFSNYNQQSNGQNFYYQDFHKKRKEVIQILGPSKQSLIFLINTSGLLHNTFNRLIQDDFIPQQSKQLFFRSISQHVYQNLYDFKSSQQILSYYQNQSLKKEDLSLLSENTRIEAILTNRQMVLAYAQSSKCNQQVHKYIDKCYSLIDS